MTTMAPYSGSLLRLALTTLAVLALLAVAVSRWQGALAPSAVAASAVQPRR